MQVKFNPTGTHIKNGLLKVRFDLYPDISSKTYAMHYVPHLDREPTKEEWADSTKLAFIPTHLELNPCLCHFITAPELFTLEDMENYAHGVFGKDIVATLDNILVLPDAIHKVSPLMRNRGRFSAKQVSAKDAVDLISSINGRFKNLVVPLEGDGKAFATEPESIAIGADATNRSSTIEMDYTVVDSSVPATGDGEIDTWEVWAYSDITGCKVATFYIVSGSWPNAHLSTRDYDSLGTVTSGSKQTFTGKSTTVLTGDYPGVTGNSSSGNIEADSSATGSYINIDAIPCTNQQFYGTGKGPISLHGTGGAGATAKTSAETGAGAEGSLLKAAMQRAETAGGTDARQSLLASLVKNENGTGVEQSLLTSFVAKLSAETGSGIEMRSLVARLFSNEVGHGADTGVIPGLKSIFGSDGGIGYDALKALIETSGAVSDMKLPGRQGQVKIPSKGVSL